MPIFISYKRGASTAIATQLYDFFETTQSTIRNVNYKPFMDREIVGGDNWWMVICDQIRGSSHFIPVLTKEYFESTFCLEELHYANRCASNIIPLRVDPLLSHYEIARWLDEMYRYTGSGGQKNIQVIDCLDETIAPSKLDEILVAVGNQAPQKGHANRLVPPPDRPVDPQEELDRIKDALDHDRLTDANDIIHSLSQISHLGRYRHTAQELIERLKDKGKYLSYLQYHEVVNLSRCFSDDSFEHQEVLSAVSELGIAAIYTSRRDAAEEVFSAISSPDTTQICLMGVSMNNFERASGNLHSSWEEIRRLAESATNDSPPLDIKILLAHPYSLGSVLRSKGEDTSLPPNARRLTNEVLNTAEKLNAMQRELDERGITTVRLDTRLYTTAPILFLCWTDSTSFVRQYLFWSEHEAATMPLLRFDNEGRETNNSKLHRELHNHFMWIWNNASVPLDDYLAGHQHGVDTALYQAGAVNVYTSNADAKARILFLIKNAKKRVWIQGITLYSYFTKDEQLTRAFAEVVTRHRHEGDSDEHLSLDTTNDSEGTQSARNGSTRGNLDVRVLLLDPDSEQARYRAYREYLIGQEQVGDEAVSYDEYIKQDLHVDSRLFLEAQFSRRSISQLQRAARNPNFQYKLFKSAPYCFMLIADDHVMIEQYHYGNEPFGASENLLQPAILGKDMPKIEYGPDVPDIFLASGKSGKGAATLNQLLEDHFNFAWQTAHDPNKKD